MARYAWRSSAGTAYYIVDPKAGHKAPVFSNDALAAELTRLTRDPWDGQHLPLRGLKFVDEDTVHFEVESSQMEPVPEEEEADEGKEEEEEEEGASSDDEEDEEDEDEDEGDEEPPAKTRKKVHHFEFKVGAQALRELPEDYEHPDNHPGWASVAPDCSWVVFARGFVV